MNGDAARLLQLTAPGIAGLQPYVPGKPIEELERELGLTHTLKLASNENPLGPSPLGLAAARRAIEAVHLYPDDIGYRLREKLAQRHGVQADALTLGAGSSDVIDMVARSFLAAGVNAVFSAHSFAMYAIYTQATGAEGRVAACLPPAHAHMPYGHDLDALSAAIDERTRVVFIANPNNPTGTWLPQAELYRFLQTLPEHLVVVLDEAYTEYVEEPEYPDGMRWIAEFPHLIVTRTFSKIYGLAGLRVGYGVSSPQLAGVINRVRHPFNVSLPALAAAEAALDDVAFVERSRRVNQTGLRQLSAGLAALQLDCIPSVGNFIAVDVGRDASAVYQGLLRKGVIVRPIANYGLPRHLRITIGGRDENERLLTVLAEVLAA